MTLWTLYIYGARFITNQFLEGRKSEFFTAKYPSITQSGRNVNEFIGTIKSRTAVQVKSTSGASRGFDQGAGSRISVGDVPSNDDQRQFSQAFTKKCLTKLFLCYADEIYTTCRLNAIKIILLLLYSIFVLTYLTCSQNMNRVEVAI